MKIIILHRPDDWEMARRLKLAIASVADIHGIKEIHVINSPPDSEEEKCKPKTEP